MSKRILLIGDANGYCINAITKLKEKHETEHIKYLRTAFIKDLKRYQLIVIEIMTDSFGIYSKEETSDDLRAGLVYYEKEVAKLNIPVLFWSWSDHFREDIESKKNPLLGFVHKTMEMNFLVDGVDNFLESINKIKEED